MDKSELEENFCDHCCDIYINCCRGNLSKVFFVIQGKLKSFNDRYAKIHEVALTQVLT